MELKQSNVVFNEADHTYWLDGRQLSGITGVIRRHIFPDKYAGVPEAVLNARAEFGHAFHKDMELYINTGIESSSDIFRVFKDNYSGIRFTHSEYIVTDGRDFASPIDAVDADGCLYDFKTSSSKDYEYWRWQLSAYRYMFRLQNGFAPAGLRVIWINKDLKHELVEISNPIPEEHIADLFAAEVEGRTYENPYRVSGMIIPEDRAEAIALLEEEIIRREEELKTIKKNHESLKSELLAAMSSNGITSWETDRMKVSLKAAYRRQTVDSKALKERHPDVYSEVLKESMVKESLIIRLKNSSEAV